MLQKKTGWPQRVAAGVTAVAAGLVLAGHTSELLANVASLAYPMYASFKAIESKDKDDDTQWLMYWVTLSAVLMAEAATGDMITWLPAYQISKVVFFLWCSLPQTRGSLVVYRYLIQPFLRRHERNIDEGIDSAMKKAESVVDSLHGGD